MKRIKLLCLLLLPFAASAQHIELGLSAGAGLFTGTHSDIDYYTRTLKPQVYSALTLALRFTNYDITLKLAGSPIQGEYSDYFIDNMIYAQNPTSIMLQGNRHKKIGRLDIYGGICAGLITYKNPDVKDLADLYPTALFASSNGVGSVVGVQAGCDYAVSRRISLNLNVDADYVAIKAENNYYVPSGYPFLKYNYSFVSIPVSVGVKYKFGKAARKGVKANSSNK